MPPPRDMCRPAGAHFDGGALAINMPPRWANLYGKRIFVKKSDKLRR
jgi:hypothetical protein